MVQRITVKSKEKGQKVRITLHEDATTKHTLTNETHDNRFYCAVRRARKDMSKYTVCRPRVATVTQKKVDSKSVTQKGGMPKGAGMAETITVH